MAHGRPSTWTDNGHRLRKPPGREENIADIYGRPPARPCQSAAADNVYVRQSSASSGGTLVSRGSSGRDERGSRPRPLHMYPPMADGVIFDTGMTTLSMAHEGIPAP